MFRQVHEVRKTIEPRLYKEISCLVNLTERFRSDYESEGRRFESCRARHTNTRKTQEYKRIRSIHRGYVAARLKSAAPCASSHASTVRLSCSPRSGVSSARSESQPSRLGCESEGPRQRDREAGECVEWAGADGGEAQERPRRA